MGNDFSPLTIAQLKSHCGPCSLSYCLYLLGIEATQRQLAHAAGLPFRVWTAGLDEFQTRKAATAYGVKSAFVDVRNKDYGPKFAAKLRRHLMLGHPALLLVNTYGAFGHWIAVLGIADDGRFIIADPNDTDRAFSKWTDRTLLQNGWNENDDEGDDDPDQYFAILLKRRDGWPMRWHLTDAWMDMVYEGSEETLSELAKDIVEVARRAGGIVKGRGVELAKVLQEDETLVCNEVAHWVDVDVGVRELRELYRDFTVTADSLKLQVPRSVNRSSLVAQMTVLLATWVWAGEL